MVHGSHSIQGQISPPVSASTRAGRNQPTTDLINAYEANDERFEASITYYKTRPDATDSVPYINKYKYPFPGNNARLDINFPVYRYADVLLLLAEVHNDQEALSNRSIELLNEVRNRAGLPPKFPGASNPQFNITDQQDLREAIWQERQVELAFENKRWFDLLRNNRALEVMEAHGSRQRQEKENTLNSSAYQNIRLDVGLPGLEVQLFNYRQNDDW